MSPGPRKDPIADALLELTLRDARIVREQLAAHGACTELCNALKTQLASAEGVCEMAACGYDACRRAMEILEDNDRAVAAAGCSCPVVSAPWVEPACAAVTPESRSRRTSHITFAAEPTPAATS